MISFSNIEIIFNFCQNFYWNKHQFFLLSSVFWLFVPLITFVSFHGFMLQLDGIGIYHTQVLKSFLPPFLTWTKYLKKKMIRSLFSKKDNISLSYFNRDIFLSKRELQQHSNVTTFWQMFSTQRVNLSVLALERNISRSNKGSQAGG